jgi:hypothetical protein
MRFCMHIESVRNLSHSRLGPNYKQKVLGLKKNDVMKKKFGRDLYIQIEDYEIYRSSEKKI